MGKLYCMKVFDKTTCIYIWTFINWVTGGYGRLLTIIY